jgi:hypothetical protein
MQPLFFYRLIHRASLLAEGAGCKSMSAHNSDCHTVMCSLHEVQGENVLRAGHFRPSVSPSKFERKNHWMDYNEILYGCCATVDHL